MVFWFQILISSWIWVKNNSLVCISDIFSSVLSSTFIFNQFLYYSIWLAHEANMLKKTNFSSGFWSPFSANKITAMIKLSRQLERKFSYYFSSLLLFFICLLHCLIFHLTCINFFLYRFPMLILSEIYKYFLFHNMITTIFIFKINSSF